MPEINTDNLPVMDATDFKGNRQLFFHDRIAEVIIGIRQESQSHINLKLLDLELLANGDCVVVCFSRDSTQSLIEGKFTRETRYKVVSRESSGGGVIKTEWLDDE